MACVSELTNGTQIVRCSNVCLLYLLMVIQNFLPTNLTDYITDDALFFHTRSWNSMDDAMAHSSLVITDGRMQGVSIHSLSFLPLSHGTRLIRNDRPIDYLTNK